MKRERPDDLISTLNGEKYRDVLLYIAWLEGIAAAVKWQPAPKAAAPQQRRPKPLPEFSFQCGACRFARKVPPPEGSDKTFLVLCDEPTYGQGKNLIQQARSLGPCGPRATLREPMEQAPVADAS